MAPSEAQRAARGESQSGKGMIPALSPRNGFILSGIPFLLGKEKSPLIIAIEGAYSLAVGSGVEAPLAIRIGRFVIIFSLRAPSISHHPDRPIASTLRRNPFVGVAQSDHSTQAIRHPPSVPLDLSGIGIACDEGEPDYLLDTMQGKGGKYSSDHGRGRRVRRNE